MSSCIVIRVVLLACLTLLAILQRLRGLNLPFSRVCAYPNAPGRRMNFTLVTLELVRAPKSIRAFCVGCMR
jgi:hypothetical protein